ncbi:MAG TPA: cyclic nucleotide-binding domain-containing protein [Rhizomicrobium sp.]|jgi:CRP-like cAMP-binding protein|nr:cyclic nucleotide-binding domain-containing protein [Rhizomicrobium sp.]
MVAGLALFSLPVGIIANGFVTGLSRRRFAITWNMLRRQPLFQGLDGDAMTEVLDAPTASIVREHAQIVVEGKEATDCYLIVSGIAHGEFADEQRPLGPGDVVGAEALHHAATYAGTVTAESDMRLIVFAGDELRRLCRKFPLLRERVEAILRRGAIAAPANRREDFEMEILQLRKTIAAIMVDRHA